MSCSIRIEMYILPHITFGHHAFREGWSWYRRQSHRNPDIGLPSTARVYGTRGRHVFRRVKTQAHLMNWCNRCQGRLHGRCHCECVTPRAREFMMWKGIVCIFITRLSHDKGGGNFTGQSVFSTRFSLPCHTFTFRCLDSFHLKKMFL